MISGFLSSVKSFIGGANGGSQNKDNKPPGKARPVFKRRIDYAKFALSSTPNPYLEAVIKEIISNSVGGAGISITPQPLDSEGNLDKELQAKMSKLWRENKDRLDAGGRHSWAGLNKLIARETFAGGEAFIIKCYSNEIENEANLGFMLKGFSAVPFDTSEGFKDGVKCNRFGKATKYKFSDGLKSKNLDRKYVIHSACYERADDTRGVSAVAPACELAVELDYYDKDSSQLVAASKRLAMFAISKDEIDIPAGVPLIHIKGEKDKVEVKGVASNLNNAYSKEHRKNIHRSMCAAVGTGYGAVSGEFEGSYSASRQEMIVAAQNDLARQVQIIDGAIKKIYEEFISRCMGLGLIRHNGGDIYNARYVAPRREHIDPLKEAKAIALKLATNQITLSDALSSIGKDFDLHLSHLKNEMIALEAHGLQPNGIEALKWLQLNVKDDDDDQGEK